MPSYDRNISIEFGTTIEVDMAELYPGVDVAVTSSLPAWFTNNTFLGYSTYWTITPPTIGTFTYNVNIYNDDEPTLIGTGVITLTVADIYENIDNCCSDSNINIVWLNRQGGRGNYIFTQRKDTNVKIGEEKTYKVNGVIKRSEVRNVYDGKIVYSTGLSQNQVDFLDTLRYAIQAWEFHSDTLEFVPILLDINSFTKYSTKENMYELNISYIYAEELKIQNQ